MNRLAKLNAEIIVCYTQLYKAQINDNRITIISLRNKLNQQKEFIVEELQKEIKVSEDTAKQIVTQLYPI